MRFQVNSGQKNDPGSRSHRGLSLDPFAPLHVAPLRTTQSLSASVVSRDAPRITSLPGGHRKQGQVPRKPPGAHGQTLRSADAAEGLKNGLGGPGLSGGFCRVAQAHSRRRCRALAAVIVLVLRQREGQAVEPRERQLHPLTLDQPNPGRSGIREPLDLELRRRRLSLRTQSEDPHAAAPVRPPAFLGGQRPMDTVIREGVRQRPGDLCGSATPRGAGASAKLLHKGQEVVHVESGAVGAKHLARFRRQFAVRADVFATACTPRGVRISPSLTASSAGVRLGVTFSRIGANPLKRVEPESRVTRHGQQSLRFPCPNSNAHAFEFVALATRKNRPDLLDESPGAEAEAKIAKATGKSVPTGCSGRSQSYP